MAGRARRGDPDLQALEIGKRLERPVLADGEHHAGKPAELDRGADVLSHGLRPQCVLVRACCDIDRAGEQRIERLPAAFEIAHVDGEAVVAEMAAPLRDRHRQVIKMRLVGDAKLERGAFKLLSMRQIERDRAEQQACHSCGESTTVVLHFCHGNGYTTKVHCSCGVRVSMLRPRLRWSSISAAAPIMRP